MKTVFFIVSYFTFLIAKAQSTESDVLVPSTQEYRNLRKIISNQERIRPRGDDGCQTKIILINYHFMLDNNGKNNFTETHDGYNNTQRSGYEYAIDGVQWANNNIWNIQHRLPPNNSIPIENKNYRFVLNGVYFHRDSTYNKLGSIGFSDHAVLSPDKSIVDIFCQRKNNEHKFFPFVEPDGTGGYASSTNPTDPKFFCFNNYSVYKEFVKNFWFRYKGFTFTDYKWTLEASFNEHEAGHLFGLDHTVLYGHGAPCPTMKFGGFVDPNCDDGIWDTKTAWYMTDVLNSPIHPADRSDTAYNKFSQWQTNNLMDYTEARALTPQQLNVVHYNFEHPMKKYLLCDRLNTDKIFNSFSFPIIGYYGKNVEINKNTTNLMKINNRQYVNVYSSENITLYSNFEVDNNASFELLNSCACF